MDESICPICHGASARRDVEQATEMVLARLDLLEARLGAHQQAASRSETTTVRAVRRSAPSSDRLEKKTDPRRRDFAAELHESYKVFGHIMILSMVLTAVMLATFVFVIASLP